MSEVLLIFSRFPPTRSVSKVDQHMTDTLFARNHQGAWNLGVLEGLPVEHAPWGGDGEGIPGQPLIVQSQGEEGTTGAIVDQFRSGRLLAAGCAVCQGRLRCCLAPILGIECV
jgi:hypothetical protein